MLIVHPLNSSRQPWWPNSSSYLIEQRKFGARDQSPKEVIGTFEEFHQRSSRIAASRTCAATMVLSGCTEASAHCNHGNK